jgi:hypothetical protein
MLAPVSREVSVTIVFGRETITAQWAIGSQPGAALAWEAPVQAPGAPAFWETDDGHAFILEVLALTHFPNVDALVLALPAGDVGAHRPRLEQTYRGIHDVRNTECRSQRLTVHVRRVTVVAQPQAASA